MEEFELKLRISPSDTQFRKTVGPDIYNKIKNDTFKREKFTCKGCGFHPLSEEKALSILSLHVIEVNEESLEESICNILCKACHSTQHIDISIEKEWVQLVNSTYSQKSLIEQCRINAIHNGVKEDEIRYLKTPSLEFLEKIKNEVLPINSKAKIIFTSKFEWGDL